MRFFHRLRGHREKVPIPFEFEGEHFDGHIKN